MKYNITFYYIDGETLNIDVHPDDMKTFMDTIGRSEVYFNETKGLGVWVPIDKIRYFHVEKLDSSGKRVIEEKVIEVNE